MNNNTKNNEKCDYAEKLIEMRQSNLESKMMDEDSEFFLREILRQYDDNADNVISFNNEDLPEYLRDSEVVHLEKLCSYGMLKNFTRHNRGAVLTISNSAKKYFDDKDTNEIKPFITEEKGKESRTYDVFVSHATQDKEKYVDKLVAIIKESLPIKVFYDRDIAWGDNWKKRILDGIDKSEFAIIVISEHFFGREWTEKELNGFLQQQNEMGQKIVLPLLLRVSIEDVVRKYPNLEEIQCKNAGDHSLEDIVLMLAGELIKRYREN